MNIHVKDFGAIADGKTLNTAAIQSAIDACSASGGGSVIVSGELIHKIGTAEQPDNDTSEPGIVIKINCN